MEEGKLEFPCEMHSVQIEINKPGMVPTLIELVVGWFICSLLLIPIVFRA
jgi:hypothetical protein